MKQLIKNITPPIIYALLRKLLVKPKTFSPKWNTLIYKPLEGLQIFFDPTGPWQKTILNNTYDTFLFKRLNSEALQGKIIYDIGAHIGFHSLYFARLVGPKGKIYAFEPNQKNVERLKLIRDKNNDIRNTVSIFDVAVSDILGSEEFSMSEDIESGRSSGGFIDTADTIWERGAFKQRGFTETKVRTVPLDLFKKELGIQEAPDLIKIDVEGAESLVLLGAKNTLLNKKPIILLEVHSMLNMFNVVLILSSLSYELEIIKEETDGRCFIEARPKSI
ncbi:MAG: FkbM family methyltransferase [Patescibacteria group bacterium]